jgi:DNA primase
LSRFSPQFLDELRGRTLLSALVGRNVKLTRAGREWKACCPFHHEKSPSFYVNDDKGFYHCFGCSAHGDAIRWMTDQQGLSFLDAVKELADNAGLTLPAPDPRAAERDERASKQHDVMAAAAEWFAAQLRTEGGAEARNYLARRGIAPATVEAFGMGFAPDRRDALKGALASFGDAALIEAGLLISVEEKAPYDRFRGRLMIPIRDPRGRVIAFGGRILGAGEPKYLNSPDTPLFDKGRTLYNLDRAAAAARKSGRLLVVEGYMDVIALAQAGIAETVAPLGTALTEAQIERLWRVVDVPVLCLDGDSAGRKAAVRAAERALPLLAPGRSLSIAMLPAGKDPDDVVRSAGTAAFEPLVDGALSLVDLLWEHELAALPLKTPEARAGLKRRLAELSAMISDSDVRDQYREELRQRFDAAFFAPRVERRPGPARTGRPNGKKWFEPAAALPGANARRIGGGGVDALYGRAIMAGLLRHPALITTCAEALSMLVIEDNELDRLRSVLLEAAYAAPSAEPGVEPGGIDTIFVQAGLSALVESLRRANGLAFSFTRGEADAETARRDLALAIEALASRPELDAALEAATARLAMGPDADGFAEQMRLVAARAEANRALAALWGEDED